VDVLCDHDTRALCMPAVEAVSIINTSEQEELHLFSISTDSVHFHSSFFKQSVRLLSSSSCPVLSVRLRAARACYGPKTNS
jgi:hypothetical protein